MTPPNRNHRERGPAPADFCGNCGREIAAGVGRFVHGADTWCVPCHERNRTVPPSPKP